MTDHTQLPTLSLVAVTVFAIPALCAAAPPGNVWSKPELVASSDKGDALYPQLGMDDHGNALAIWQQLDGARFDMWSSHYVPGTGWSKPELIEHSDDGGAVNPRIVVEPGGNAVAIWMQGSGKTSRTDGDQFNAWSNRYTVGRGWGNAEMLDAPGTGQTRFPHVAIDGKGNAIAAWSRADGGLYNLWSSHFTANGKWSKPELIEFDDTGHALWAWASVDGEGNGLVTWHQFDKTWFNIWANRYTPAKGWEKPQLIENASAGSGFYPHTVFDRKGNAIAVWEQFDEKTSHIWSNLYSAGRGWGKPEPIDRPDATNSVYPYMEIDADGNAVVVWSQGNGRHAWSNRYVSGKGWGKAEQISTGDAPDLNTVRVAVDANGNAYAVWQQDTDSNYDMWANRYVVGQGWGKAALLEHSDAGPALGAAVASDRNGHAIAMWHQSDGKRFTIWASHAQ
jgi:hypothetical protein